MFVVPVLNRAVLVIVIVDRGENVTAGCREEEGAGVPEQDGDPVLVRKDVEAPPSVGERVLHPAERLVRAETRRERAEEGMDSK